MNKFIGIGGMKAKRKAEQIKAFIEQECEASNNTFGRRGPYVVIEDITIDDLLGTVTISMELEEGSESAFFIGWLRRAMEREWPDVEAEFDERSFGSAEFSFRYSMY
jgi:hypothetical protein